MAMVGRAMEQKNRTDEVSAARHELAKGSKHGSFRGKLPTDDLAEPSLTDQLNKVQQYHGVSEHFERDFEVSDAVKAELQQALDGRLPAAQRRHSGEVESYTAPAKKVPIRWEPFIDENAQAAYPVEATPHATPHKSGGHGVVAVLREQLNAERDRAEQVQERLDAALAAASEANTRAARAEAKLEMTQQMLSKLEAKAGKA